MSGGWVLTPGGARLSVLGDSCVSVQFADVIDPVVNDQCVALAGVLTQRGIRGVRDVVTTYNAVTVHFDPSLVESATVVRELRALADDQPRNSGAGSRTIDIPVNYGGEFGPDLRAVAEFARCSEADVVRLHSGTRYRVYVMGFLPGFAYMGSVDARIAMPRLDTPRVRVAAGSVAIAAHQTGIYPCDTPGGWRILGRTSTRLFDASRPEPFFLKAGDQVSFVPA
jgi:inhibitor of KinA